MNKPSYSTKDTWIHTAKGRLLARCWQPLPLQTNTVNKAPIVLLHDSLGSVELWRTFPLTLAKHTGRTVIAYDRLGFGQSELRNDILSLAFIQEEAEYYFPALCEQLAIDSFIAFGHSVGGEMAVHCAANTALNCLALITESAQAFVDDKIRVGIIEAREMFKNTDAFERLRRYHADKAQWVLNAWVNTWLSPAFAGWSLTEVLPRVNCPTLVIHGDEDEYGSVAHPQQIAQQVSAPAQLAIMQGVKHIPHREQEAQVIKLVTDFLDHFGV